MFHFTVVVSLYMKQKKTEKKTLAVLRHSCYDIKKRYAIHI